MTRSYLCSGNGQQHTGSLLKSKREAIDILSIKSSQEEKTGRPGMNSKYNRAGLNSDGIFICAGERIKKREAINLLPAIEIKPY